MSTKISARSLASVALSSVASRASICTAATLPRPGTRSLPGSWLPFSGMRQGRSYARKPPFRRLVLTLAQAVHRMGFRRAIGALPRRSAMRSGRAILFGIIGAGAISVVSAGLRAVGLPIRLEMLLGTSVGLVPSASAFALGLAMHLAIGGAFGLLYGWLFERVWNHGGASTGMILGVVHAALIGMAVGLTPRFHPMVPEHLADPGPFFAN